MANVKFFRLGFDNPVSKETYRNLIATDAANGGIIFAKVKDEDGSFDTSSSKPVPPSYYIWANGIEYKVANADGLNYAINTLNILLGDSISNPRSINTMIEEALAEYELTAAKFMEIVDTANSNVEIKIVDSSLVLTAEEQSTTEDVVSAKTVGYLTSGTTIPEGTTLQDLVDMIFTKVLGLDGATAPKATISGITAATYEVGTILSDITVTGDYVDGQWDNEEDWKNSYSDNKAYQPYGTTAQTYAFSGMTTVAAQASNTTTISNYVVAKGAQKVTVTVTNNNSQNVPVNQVGTALTSGSINNTTTYKPYTASSVTANSATITGDYKYWIGYTTVSGDALTRTDVEEMTIKSTGWAGSGVSYLTDASDKAYNTPEKNYVTIIVPSTMTLKTVADSFGNDVTANFTLYENANINLNGVTVTCNVYQEEAVAGAGLDRKNITLK